MLLPKEQFVKDTNIHYIDNGQFGENLAQSEDNKILELLYKKFKNITTLKKNEIWNIIESESNVSAVVIWTNSHFNIAGNNVNNFKPHWQEVNKLEKFGHSYQGSINNIPIYIVYKLREYKEYEDMLFIFKEPPFYVKEFEMAEDENVDTSNSKIKEDLDNCLMLSITNLSLFDQERKKIVQNWIDKKSIDPSEQDAKIEELKTNVNLKFYKGLSLDDVDIIDSNTKIFLLNK